MCVIHLPHCLPLGSWLWEHCWVRGVKLLHRWSVYFYLSLSFKCQFFKRIDGLLNLVSIEFTAPKRKRKRWPGAWWSLASELSDRREVWFCCKLEAGQRGLTSENEFVSVRWESPASVKSWSRRWLWSCIIFCSVSVWMETKSAFRCDRKPCVVC